MKIGAIFPQIEFSTDPFEVIDYAQAVEDLGYDHILAYEHVLTGTSGPYTYKDPFFSPLLLFSYLAAVTDTIEFVTGILILPQRQTALVAKQASTLDVLCEGRFRLGIGIGWNKVEYEALGKDFHNRGVRSSEQVELLRELWNEEMVDFEGQWEQIKGAGINPKPINGTIPVWFGGSADPVLRRIAKLGDGWMPNQRHPDDIRPQLDLLTRYLEEKERSWDEIGLEFRVHYLDGNPQNWDQTIEAWTEVGASHMTINTMRCGFESVDDHLEALEDFMSHVGHP